MVFHNRKITNKRREGYRGKKLRYSVFRAQLNKNWETIYKALVSHVCADNDLNVEEFMSNDNRIPWEHTWHELKKKGYGLITRSIRAIQTEVEAEIAASYSIGHKFLWEQQLAFQKGIYRL